MTLWKMIIRRILIPILSTGMYEPLSERILSEKGKAYAKIR